MLQRKGPRPSSPGTASPELPAQDVLNEGGQPRPGEGRESHVGLISPWLLGDPGVLGSVSCCAVSCALEAALHKGVGGGWGTAHIHRLYLQGCVRPQGHLSVPTSRLEIEVWGENVAC